MHFCRRQKLMFGSVEPSPATLVRVALDSSNLPHPITTKKTNPFGLVFFVVGEDGFEPSKRYAADLQSVPFGHSGTPPYLIASV